jgi:hypothetical protein
MGRFQAEQTGNGGNNQGRVTDRCQRDEADAIGKDIEQFIPIPLLCDRIKENTRKHMWKGMNIIHGTSNHPSGLPSVSG